MTSLEDQQALLLYRVGPVRCCAPSLHVLSIIQPVSLTHPPGADAARPGIFHHGGHVIKTEELRVRFGVDEADRKPGRMVITEVDSGRTAFWVDEIIDVISMPTKGWGQLPPHLPKGIFSRTLLLNDKIYLYAEFDGLHKLQGHGLLKTYIEQLLTEQHHSEDKQIPPASSAARATKDKTHTIPASDGKKPVPATVDKTQTKAQPDRQAQKQHASHQPASKQPLPTPSVTRPDKPASEINSEHRPVSTKPDITQSNKPVTKSEPNKSQQTTHKKTSHQITPVSPPPVANKTLAATSKANAAPAIPTTRSVPGPQHSVSTPQTAARTMSTRKTPPQTAQQSGFPWAGLLILLLLLAGGGTGGYFYWDNQQPQQVIEYQNDNAADELYVAETSTYSAVPPNNKLTDTTTDNDAISPIEAPVDEVPDHQSTPPAPQPEPVTVQETSDTPAPTPVTDDYQARIEQDNEGITIVLRAPRTESALRLSTLKELVTEVTTGDPVDTNVLKLSDKTPSATQPTAVKPAPPQREEIIHIVVKGDTLWHIAKRYVNNPFRYPELAQLSNIKNPDLIYPGNRVRIIREFD